MEGRLPVEGTREILTVSFIKPSQNDRLTEVRMNKEASEYFSLPETDMAQVVEATFLTPFAISVATAEETAP